MADGRSQAGTEDSLAELARTIGFVAACAEAEHSKSGCAGLGAAASLLNEALSHRSWCFENPGNPSNERLEFLGDAVLSLCVVDELMGRDLTEGEMSAVRAEVVPCRIVHCGATPLYLAARMTGETGTMTTTLAGTHLTQWTRMY